MDEATQQNSALVEQNAATAKMLELQAKAMDDCVAFFKLGGTEDNDRAASASRPGAVHTYAVAGSRRSEIGRFRLCRLILGRGYTHSHQALR